MTTSIIRSHTIRAAARIAEQLATSAREHGFTELAERNERRAESLNREASRALLRELGASVRRERAAGRVSGR